MTFAKLSGSLLESDSRPARVPEHQPVPAPPPVEEPVVPTVDARDILERLAGLAEAAPCYDSLWEFIRTGDEEGVARVVAELVRAGRSVSEISEVVESLSKLIGSARPASSEHLAGELPRLGEAPELAESPPHRDPDEMHDGEAVRADEDVQPQERDGPVVAWWATDPEPEPEPEPGIDTSPHVEYDDAIWRQPTEGAAEPVIAADAESCFDSERIWGLVAAVPSGKPARRPFSARAYVGAAMAAVLAIAGAGAFLISQPAVKQVGAATAATADTGAKLAANLAAPRTGGATPPAADSAVTPPVEATKIAPVPRPVPAAPGPLAAPLASASPSAVPPEKKKAETAPVAVQNTTPAATVSAPAAATPASLAVSAGAGGDRPQSKPSAAETDAIVKAVSVAPIQPDQSAPAASMPAPTAAPTPPDRVTSDRVEASAVVASLEPPKNSPAAIVASTSAAPISAPVSAPVEPKEPPAMPVDTAPLLERGDRLFGTGEVASARLFYERAAEAGDGQAALRLGETYDPAFLERAHLRVQGDRNLAMFWYGRARELGAGEAEILLRGVQSK